MHGTLSQLLHKDVGPSVLLIGDFLLACVCVSNPKRDGGADLAELHLGVDVLATIAPDDGLYPKMLKDEFFVAVDGRTAGPVGKTPAQAAIEAFAMEVAQGKSGYILALSIARLVHLEAETSLGAGLRQLCQHRRGQSTRRLWRRHQAQGL